MPTKRLPDSANLDHLKHQARDLLRDFRAAQMSAFQRIREFHPKCSTVSDAAMPALTFSLSDAQLSIAREYGYASWPRLKAVIAEKHHEALHLSHNDRLPEGPFKQALDFMDAGDAPRLKAHLARHPGLIHEEASFEGGNYFATPTLLEFIPENPNRQGHVPGNAVEIAALLLDAGAKDNREAMNETYYGADPSAGMHSALAHGEFAAARTMIACGAPMDLPTAAALDEREVVARQTSGADEEQLQLALSLAANVGRSEVVTHLLEAGADPNRYNPPGGHSHCTPLHSAVASDQFDAVVALVDGGAELEIPDIHHKMTALGWAEYLGREQIARYLKLGRGLP